MLLMANPGGASGGLSSSTNTAAKESSGSTLVAPKPSKPQINNVLGEGEGHVYWGNQHGDRGTSHSDAAHIASGVLSRLATPGFSLDEHRLLTPFQDIPSFLAPSPFPGWAPSPMPHRFSPAPGANAAAAAALAAAAGWPHRLASPAPGAGALGAFGPHHAGAPPPHLAAHLASQALGGALPPRHPSPGLAALYGAAAAVHHQSQAAQQAAVAAAAAHAHAQQAHAQAQAQAQSAGHPAHHHLYPPPEADAGGSGRAGGAAGAGAGAGGAGSHPGGGYDHPLRAPAAHKPPQRIELYRGPGSQGPGREEGGKPAAKPEPAASPQPPPPHNIPPEETESPKAPGPAAAAAVGAEAAAPAGGGLAAPPPLRAGAKRQRKGSDGDLDRSPALPAPGALGGSDSIVPPTADRSPTSKDDFDDEHDKNSKWHKARHREYSKAWRKKKKAEENNLKEEIEQLRKFRSLVEDAPDMLSLVAVEPNFPFVFASAAYDRQVQIAGADLVGRPFCSIVHPMDQAGLTHTISQACAVADPPGVTYRVTNPRIGRVFLVETNFRRVSEGLIAVSTVRDSWLDQDSSHPARPQAARPPSHASLASNARLR